MKLLTGQRGVAILYAYMLLGLGFLRVVTPDFGDLSSREQQLEGTFRSFLIWCFSFTFIACIFSKITLQLVCMLGTCMKGYVHMPSQLLSLVVVLERKRFLI